MLWRGGYAIDDEVFWELDDLIIYEDGSFRRSFWFDEEFFAAGSVKIAAYLDRKAGYGPIEPSEEDDGNTTVILLDPILTTSLSKDVVAKGDAFRIWGCAPGAREVDIIAISPNGGNGNGLEGYEPLTGLSYTVLPVSSTHDGFTTRIDVDEDADMGLYKVIAAVPGKDGIYDGIGGWWRAGELLEGIIEVYCGGNPETLAAMSQEEIVEMIKDATINAPESDDLLEELDLLVGTAKLTALFTYTPNKPFTKQLITFDASSSYDPVDNITDYKWDFGDGDITNTTDEVINHSYISKGNYTVNLTITNTTGGKDSTSKVVSVISPAGNWNRTFGGPGYESARGVQQTADGGYILVGETNSFGSGYEDVWLLKTDLYGNELWNRTFGSPEMDWAHSIQQTDDGGYIFAGMFDWDYFWLMKTDSNGTELWNRTFGGGEAWDVQQTADGGFIGIGIKSGAGWDANFGLVKTDSKGTEQWNKTFGGLDNEWACSGQQTSDGGYILAGCTFSYGGGNGDFWLVKTDSNGTELWNQTFGGQEWEWAFSTQQTADDGFILTGFTESFGAGSSDVWLVKTDFNGKEQWNKTFGGSNSDSGHSVVQTSSGQYIVTGGTESYGTGGRDAWLIKTDSNGNELWNRTFGGPEREEAFSVQQTADRGYVLAGVTGSFGAGGTDFWLIKIKGEPTPYKKKDGGVSSTITAVNPDDLASSLPPEYADLNLSDCVVLSVNVTDSTPENTTDDAYTDLTINVGALDIATCNVYKEGSGFLLEVNDVTTLPTVKPPGVAKFARDIANNSVIVRLYVGDPLLAVVPPLSEGAVFDTGKGGYPSISGTYNGTITPSLNITVRELYTYPCTGTGGHTEYVKIWNSTGWNVTATWSGYVDDWHNITFDKTFTLYANETYNFTIRTGSYPQIIHAESKDVTGGTITCTSFEDANGNVHADWIPAIKLFLY